MSIKLLPTMRKMLLLVFVFSTVSSSFSQSLNFSKWSLTADYGYNNFIGDADKDLTAIVPASAQNITYGASLEYALTPIWGLALGYYYFPLNAANYSPAVAINTKLYNTDLNVTMNLTRLIFPQSKSKFYVNGSVGFGFSYYDFDITPNATMLSPSYSYAGSVPVALSLEYNFSKPFAIGAKVQYRAYTRDNLEGISVGNNTTQGVSNDYVAAATLFLRYKLHSIKKEHLRDIKMDKFLPNPALDLAKENAIKIEKLDTALHTLEKKVDNQGLRLDSVVGILSNDGPDTDGDGVPDLRDLGNNTPPNTPVDFWGKPIKLVDFIVANRSKLGEDVPTVYFDFDQIELDDASLVVISKIASRMKADPSLYVEVRGYCDNSGTSPYNNLLSQRRSDRVKAELVNAWKISFDHIISNGKGTVLEPQSKYRPNRRCDFFFGKL